MVVMERFLIRRPRPYSPDEASQATPSPKRTNNDGGSVNKSYKRNLKYNPDWKVKWKWMVSNKLEAGMLCAVCQKYGKPPAQARGAWVTHPNSNWSKAVELLNKHEQSEWHMASAEAQAMDESARMQGRGLQS